MCTRQQSCSTVVRGNQPENARERLRRWLWFQDASERYLAEASTHAELERRQRVLERSSGGPAFVTFNH